jgi:hypothetical protein
MQAHMLGRLVHVVEHIGLTIPQVESLQQHIPHLYLMEIVMWSTTQEIEPHLVYLLHPDLDMMVNHVNNFSIN